MYPKASAFIHIVFLTLSKPFQVHQNISIHPYCVTYIIEAISSTPNISSHPYCMPYIIEAISSTPKHQHSSILCSLHYQSHFKYPKASAFIHIVFLTLSKPFQVAQSISIHPYCVTHIIEAISSTPNISSHPYCMPYIIEAISSTPKHQYSSILCSLHYQSHFKYPKASAFIHIVFLTLSKPFQIPQSISIHLYCCIPFIVCPLVRVHFKCAS